MAMKVVIFLLSLLLSPFAAAQGTLESHFIGGRPGDHCLLLIRNLDNFERVDEFSFTDVSRVVMQGGDYRVTYWVDSTFVHGEYVHFSGNDHGVIQKFILRVPEPLVNVEFTRFKLMTPEDFEDLYMEF